MKYVLEVISGLLLSFMLAGCAQLGLEKPQSIEDRLQYGKAAVTASYRTVGDLVAGKAITKEQGAGYFQRIEGAERDLGTAESLMAVGKPAEASSKIAATLTILTAIRNELAAKAPQKGS